MGQQIIACDYELLDSGEELKLERFGPKVLVRPSAFCVWKKRGPDSSWKEAHARYVPDQGWKFYGKKFEEWDIALQAAHLQQPLNLRLRLQTNGQTGLFPEHALYLPQLESAIIEITKRYASPRILNLFAYTGMATVVSLAHGATVTHLDSAKKALTWARQNIELNSLESSSVRYMCDDAIKFLEREIKRDKEYDIVIVDPPNFSRLSGNKFWSLDKVLVTLVDLCLKVLSLERGALFFTCHNYDFLDQVVGNLILDGIVRPDLKISKISLSLVEAGSSRTLPCGCLVTAHYGF